MIALRTISFQILVIATTVMLCMLLPWVAPHATAAEPGDLKVMSFNILYSNDDAGEMATPHAWNDPAHPRRERVTKVVREFMPDLLGLQESRKHQVDNIQAALPEMEHYSVGRDDGREGGESCPIYYRKDRFDRLAEGSFWLSPTPETPGTTFSTMEEGAWPRMSSWLKLRDKQSGSELVVINTHWDWQDPDARERSARLMRERLPAIAADLPVIAMGDLNAPDGTPELKAIRGDEPPAKPRLIDSYRAVHPSRKPTERTHHGHEGTTEGERIDFILCSEQLKPIQAAIVHTNYDARWPSDHYPVTATLRYKPQQ